MSLPRSTGAAIAAVLVVTAIAPAIPAVGQVTKPPTNARIDDNYTTSGNRVVLKLKAINVVVGTVAQVKCSGGKAKGCPKPLRGKTRTITATKAGSLSLRSALADNKLAKGAVVTITLRDPGALYYRIVFKVTSSTGLSISGTCEQPAGPAVSCA